MDKGKTTFSTEVWAKLNDTEKRLIHLAFEAKAGTKQGEEENLVDQAAYGLFSFQTEAKYYVFWRGYGDIWTPDRQYFQTAGGTVVAEWVRSTYQAKIDAMLVRESSSR